LDRSGERSDHGNAGRRLSPGRLPLPTDRDQRHQRHTDSTTPATDGHIDGHADGNNTATDGHIDRHPDRDDSAADGAGNSYTDRDFHGKRDALTVMPIF
jgi:hypothetical protein